MKGSLVTDDAQALADHLAEEIRTTSRVYAETARQLGEQADKLADLEARYRATLHRLGIYRLLAGPRELAAEIALGRLQSLRPNLPTMDPAAADRAERALQLPLTFPTPAVPVAVSAPAAASDSRGR